MRAILFLVAALWVAPSWAQNSDNSPTCVAHEPVVQPGGANYEDQRYSGLHDWYGVQLANRCSQVVVAQICIASPTGQAQCNVISIYPGHNDDYGFPDAVAGPPRYSVTTCFESTMAAGRCSFSERPAPFVPYEEPGDDYYGYGRRVPPPAYDPPYSYDRRDSK